MTTLIEISSTENNQSHDRIALLFLVGLLFIRLPFLAGIALFTSPNPIWLSPIYEIVTYILTVCLVWWERKRLAEFNIDAFVVAIIIFFKPIETLILTAMEKRVSTHLPLAFPSIPAIIIWIVAFCLLLAFLKEQPRLPNIKGKTIVWFIIGAMVGILTAILLAYPGSFQIGNGEHINSLPPFNLNDTLIFGFLYQIGYAAVSEEPLFRGFLWGYLKKAGWRDLWIWLFQAGLFWLGHIYYFGKLSVSFWLIVPIGGLMLGGLVWRSRSIATSIAAHAAVNGLALFLANIALYYFR